jgi:nicotinamide riboside transporter PnuC
MIEILAGLGRTLGFSFAAGINLYATVAILGLASRYGWVSLPEQYRVFDSDLIIGVAITLYVVEFFADKIPWVDSIWDAIHTAIRPIGGAVIAVQTLGDASPAMQTVVGLMGGTLAASTHFTKAGTRAVANASPEPFTNWILSFAEDVFVVSLGFVALKYPLLATIIVLVALVLMITFAAWIVRAVKRRWQRPAVG